MRLGLLLVLAGTALGLWPAAPVHAQGPAMEFLMEQMRGRDDDRRRALQNQFMRRQQLERRTRQRQVERARVQTAPARAPEFSDQSPRVAAVEKAPNAGRLLVIGDEFAEALGAGLTQAVAGDANLVVVPATRPGAGLAQRAGQPDLVALAREALASGPAPAAVVVMAGMNDRQTIAGPGAAAEFRSDRWRELYQARVDAVLQVFAERRIPVYWTGLPAMRQAGDAADASFLNDLFKARAFAASARLVDTWEGFVDEDGRYAAVGPDINGNQRRLRQADGIGLTPAGARKLAFYVETEIRRDLPQGGAALARLAPAEEQPPAPAERAPDRPYVGPVLPLYPPPAPADAQLAGPVRPRTGDDLATRVLVRGEPTPARAGRADDFRWPRDERMAWPGAPATPTTTAAAPPLR